MDPMNVLISLHRGYGLGDAVQMSAVLKHVRKYRPHWIIDYQAEEGRECVGRGIAHNVFAYGEKQPSPHYDAEVQICLYDTWANWKDRPNTRVSSCLHERFGLEWDRECGRYEINVSDDAKATAGILLNLVEPWPRDRSQIVAFHYIGDSSPLKKNLTDKEAIGISGVIHKFGYIPLALDWRNARPMPLSTGIFTTGGYVFSQVWGRSAEMNCAVISQCAAFIGIDSGPSKCASATDTPSLVVWTGHHPAPFHDPAPNTTHLVPEGYHGLEPVCNDPDVIKWFEENHLIRTYKEDPVPEIERWLWDTLPRV